MTEYVAASKQAGAWVESRNNFTGMLDKVGKQITLVGGFYDRLEALNGDDLPLGKTIEEYFIDLTLPTSFTSAAVDGAKDLEPALPSVGEVSYSYSLGRQYVKTTVPYDNFERAMISTEGASNVATDIMTKLQNSYDMARYAIKKQLLGNAGRKAYPDNTGNLPTIETATDGENWIKTIKTDIESAQFANTTCLANAGVAEEDKVVIGAAPELVLYVKKGVIPALEVTTYAGAFNRGDLAVPARIEVVDDFGDNGDLIAILADSRAIKLHNGYNAVRSKENATGDFINFVRHYEVTGFISKYAFIKAYFAE